MHIFVIVKLISKQCSKVDEVSNAIEAILTYKDKNFDSKIPVYNFWPQKLINGTYYSAYPTNLEEPMKHFPSIASFVEFLLRIAGLKNWEKKVKDIANSLEVMAKSFHIPADTDDSSVNLSLGGCLQKVKSNTYGPKYNPIIAKWKQENVDYDALFDLMIKYSYQPNVSTEDLNDLIDSRTYFLIRKFLQMQQKNNKEVILPATWLTNVNNDRKQYPYISMPFHVNNVDLSVCANFLFGISSHVLYNNGAGSLVKNTKLVQMIQSTTDLLVYSLKNELPSFRPDLALLYYPSIFDFYWFIGRTYFILDNYRDGSGSKSLPHPILEYVREQLQIGTRQYVSQQILKLARRDIKLQHAYFDDFLGDTGKERGEDRIFSTALATNALLDSWTYQQSSTCKRQWVDSTPAPIKQLVEWSIRFIFDKILHSGAILMNAFFSGSVKSADSLPWFFPGNYYYFLNGTQLSNPHYPSTSNFTGETLIAGMKSIIDNDTYENVMLNQTWFYRKVPQQFPGYNNATFPFWSSTPMTYSTAILSLSKFVAIQECH